MLENSSLGLVVGTPHPTVHLGEPEACDIAIPTNRNDTLGGFASICWINAEKSPVIHEPGKPAAAPLEKVRMVLQ